MDIEKDITSGKWGYACDSYGKVQHSRKACVYTTVTTPNGDRIVKVAAQIPNWADARVISASPKLYEALKYMNHVQDGGYCICPLNDGTKSDRHHATVCADARKAIRSVESDWADPSNDVARGADPKEEDETDARAHSKDNPEFLY